MNYLSHAGYTHLKYFYINLLTLINSSDLPNEININIPQYTTRRNNTFTIPIFQANADGNVHLYNIISRGIDVDVYNSSLSI